jgi:hypothetical protein
LEKAGKLSKSRMNLSTIFLKAAVSQTLGLAPDSTIHPRRFWEQTGRTVTITIKCHGTGSVY